MINGSRLDLLALTFIDFNAGISIQRYEEGFNYEWIELWLSKLQDLWDYD